MATFRTRKKKNGEVTHQAIVRISGHDPRSQSFSSRAKAVEWAEATAVTLRSLTHTTSNPKKFNKTLLTDAIDEYIAWPNSAKTFHAHLRTMKAHCGVAPLSSITKIWLSKYVELMKVTPSQYGRVFTEATLAKHITALRAVLKRQADLNHVKPELSGLSADVLSKGWDKMRDRRLSKSEEDSIRAQIKNSRYSSQWGPLLDLALETAAREAEMILSTPDEFHLSERVWIIPAEHTKSKKSRQVPLSKSAFAVAKQLHDMLAKHNQELRKADPNAPLETRLFWQFANASSVSTAFHKITLKLGIKDLRFHDLRHEGITRMVLFKRKLSVFEIMKIVGHESMTMLNRYANLRGGDLVDRMD